MKHSCTAIVFLLVTICLVAQTPNWLNYTYGEYISCIAEEGNFLWVGTNGGLVKLNKFNGNPVFYNKANSGLADNTVSAIAIDSQNNKWIGTNQGLCKFDGTVWQTYNPPEHSQYYMIQRIVVGNQDSLWIGSEYAGLHKFDGISTWIDYSTLYPNAPWYYLKTLSIDSNNNLWMGTYGSLCKFDGTAWTNYEDPYTDADSIYVDYEHLVIDSQDNIWVGVYPNSLVKFDGTDWTCFPTIPNLETSGFPLCLFCDGLDNIWMSTYAGNLAKFNGTDWTIVIESGTSVFTSYLEEVFVDSQNIPWVGSNGLFKQTGTNWTKQTTSNSGLPGRAVISIAEDYQNCIWMSTYSGIARYNCGIWTTYTSSDIGLSFDSVYNLTTDQQGNLWCIIYSYEPYSTKILRFDGVNWTVFDSTTSNLPLWIYCLTIDSQNNVWIGAGGAKVYKYDGIDWTMMQFPAPLPNSNYVEKIGTDSQNNIWALGSFGLAKYDGTSWTVYPHDYSLIASGDYFSMYIDAQDSIWIGTSGGILKFDGANWSAYTTDNSGIPYNYVIALCKDNSGNLWFNGCEKEENGSLVKFDGTTWTCFDEFNSGLQSTSITSIIVDFYDNIWIGTYDGVAVYNETGIVATEDDTQSPVVVSSIKAYPNPFRQSGAITFETALKTDETGSITIYNLKGQKVKSFEVNGKISKLSWNSKDENNRLSASGIYFYRLSTKKHQETKKLVILE